jgi:hypothetical protein
MTRAGRNSVDWFAVVRPLRVVRLMGLNTRGIVIDADHMHGSAVGGKGLSCTFARSAATTK